MVRWTTDKLQLLRFDLDAGMTFEACGEKYGVSRQRVFQLHRKHFPDLDLYGKAKTAAQKRMLDYGRKKAALRRLNRETWRYANDLEAAMSLSFSRKKANAAGRSRKTGERVEFTIERSDLEWPTHCPVLGIEIDWYADVRQENSPSFDRVDPKKGYIPGNVKIVSWRANRIKNDGTAAEHHAIAAWLDKQQILT